MSLLNPEFPVVNMVQRFACWCLTNLDKLQLDLKMCNYFHGKILVACSYAAADYLSLDALDAGGVNVHEDGGADVLAGASGADATLHLD